MLLEEQRKEEKDRGETGTWENGVVRVPLPRREEEREEEWERTERVRFSQQVRQTVPAANETEADAFWEDGPDDQGWTVRRWAAGETELIQAGLRTTEREPVPSYRQAVGEEPSLAGITPVGSGAGWLDQAVRVSLYGLPRPEQEDKVVTLELGAEDQRGRGLELRRLDRLVRRDARRFDGGFQLL